MVPEGGPRAVPVLGTTREGDGHFPFWLAADRRMARRITRLIAEVLRDPFAGIGKPEPLKADLSGYWSRRIDDEYRLVYRADDKEVKILKARYHYG
ncbi:Txe/YoeB family addiction module toxin [Streptomyces griseoluteus]|uniref:Txe/YoeB family addiction module toxin n=1 Tax=Streptomyces griseoluteus TaxID=29306 RepID=UPI003F4CF857